MRGLTFELRRPRRRTPTGRGRTIYTKAWSGQAVGAVAGRRLSEGLGRTRDADLNATKHVRSMAPHPENSEFMYLDQILISETMFSAISIH